VRRTTFASFFKPAKAQSFLPASACVARQSNMNLQAEHSLKPRGHRFFLDKRAAVGIALGRQNSGAEIRVIDKIEDDLRQNKGV
jgi:hypothetical protein